MNNTTLAVIQPQEMDTIVRAGKMMAASGYFDGKGASEQAIAMMATKIMAGREMGFGPFASVNGVHIISGKPTIGANLMASAVKASGRYDYRVRELTDTVCKLEFFERVGDKRESLGVSEFDMKDAEKAGVLNNPTWKKYARNMLFARALSNGVRWHCPDIFAGNAVYVPEEIGAEVDEDGNVVDATFVVTPQQAPQPPATGNRATTTPKTPQGASVQAEGDGTPPHQRCFGVGLSVFGPAWNNGGRKWLLEKWSTKATPDNVRDSFGDFGDDEKDALADYMTEHATDLQRIWRKYEADKKQVA